jgi:hypothetical protein
MDKRSETTARVVGGVDAHKDLHVAAVVDERDRVLATSRVALRPDSVDAELLCAAIWASLERRRYEVTRIELKGHTSRKRLTTGGLRRRRPIAPTP